MEKLLLTNDTIRFKTDNDLLITVKKSKQPIIYEEVLNIIKKYEIPYEYRRAV